VPFSVIASSGINSICRTLDILGWPFLQGHPTSQYVIIGRSLPYDFLATSTKLLFNPFVLPADLSQQAKSAARAVGFLTYQLFDLSDY
jgi:hypothetical protein